MADFLLSVGIDTQLSYGQMQSDIAGLVSRINSNPPRIRVAFDDASLNTMRRQINDLSNDIRNLGATPVPSGRGAANVAAQQYRDASKAIREYYAALTKLNKSKSDVTLTANGWQSASGHYAELANTLNRTKTAFDLVTNSMHNMPVQQQVQLQALLTSETNKYNLAVEQEANKVRLAAEAHARAAAAAQQSATANATLTVGTKEHSDALTKVNTLLTQVTSNTQKWTAASTGKSKGAYQTYASQASELQILRDRLQQGTISAQEFAAAYSRIKSTVSSSAATIKAAGENTKTLGQQIVGLSQKFGTWFGITRVIMMAVQTCKKMVSASIELDTAITELKKVTDETDATYERFLTNATSRAKELGASLTDTVTATADFARLGFNIEDAEKLADAAIVYKNVGDGITDISDASESVIATMQAFGIEASDVMSIVDKFNEVGNNYAISSKGIGDALLRSASAMEAANNTLDETIALTTAANTIVQDPDKVGTTLKTVSMYLRAAKTEAEEAGESTEGMASSVSELRDEILDLTGQKVDIQIDENTFKSTYQIFKELSEVWGELTDITQANILELVGGKRNSNVVAALLSDFELAEEVLQTAAGAEGSALEENSKYLESIEGRISILKASFQDLSESVMNGSMIKFFVDAGTAILELLNGITKIVEALGGLKTVLVAVSGALIAINLNSIIASMTKIGTSVGAFFGRIKELPMALRIAKSEGKGLSSALSLVGVSASTAQLAIGAITAAITIAVAAYSRWRQNIEQQRSESISAAKASAEEADNIMDLYSAYQDANIAYESNAGTKDALTQATSDLLTALGYEESEIDSLITKYGSLDEAINNVTLDALTKATQDAQSGLNAAYDNLQDSFGNGSDWGASIAKYFGFGDGQNILSWVEESEELNQKLAKILQDAGLISEGMYGTTGGTMLIDTDSVDGIIESYNKLIQAQKLLQDGLSEEEYQDSGAVDMIEGKIADFEATLTEYLDAKDLFNKSLAKEEIFQSLSDNGIPQTAAELDALKASLLSAAEGNDRFSGSSEDVANAFTAAWNELRDAVPGLADVMEQASNTTDETVARASQNVEDVAKAVELVTSQISKAQEVLSNQETGKSISLEDFNSSELADYRDALEYVNGSMQLNADKVNEIIQAKSEEQIAINNTNKALAQAEYLENAKKIEQYRQKLKDANYAAGENEENIRSSIDALLSENDALLTTCAQYDIMTSSLKEATSAYQHWLNAQNASQSGDMFDSALSAFEKMHDTLNDAESDDFGRIGNEDYKAAVDFVVPDSVDKEDQSAVKSYMESINEYFTFDSDGNRTGLDIEQFCKNAIEKGLMVMDESGENFLVAGQTTMEDFAEGLGLSLPLVQAMFGEMEEFGAEFDWSDEAVESFGDLAVKANESAEALRQLKGNEDLLIKLDVSDLATTEEQLAALDGTISEMETVKKASVDASEIEHANNVIQYCITQKQLLTQPDVMRVDTSQVEGDIGNAISLLQQFQEAQNTLEIQSKVGADTTDAQAKVDELAGKIQAIPTDIKTKLSLDTTSTSSIQESINGLKASIMVDVAGVNAEAITGYQPETKTCEVIYNPNTDLLPTSFTDLERCVKYVPDTDGLPSYFRTLTRYVNYVAIGDHQLNGTAHASGTAKVGGDWGTATGGSTLVGELGREIVVDPRTGKWYTVGDMGAEFVNIPAGAIVFNHLQTESLLKQGFVAGRGMSLVSGTAMVTGGISVSQSKKPSTSQSTKNSSSKNKSSSKKTSNSNSNNSDEEPEVFDWIELAIDRIERAISRLGITAESTFKKLATRLSATDDEIVKITEEIGLQQQAYDRYIQEANSVGLSSSLAKQVRNGAIDIDEYDKETAELIKEYQEWYEKALDCSDAIKELHENVAELYQEKFDMKATEFDNRLALLEHMTTTFDNGVADLEERGYLASTEYYKAMQDTESEKLKVQKEELNSLINAMSQAVNSGSIKEGSEAWYEMQQEINDTKQAIQESETAMIKFGNSIREVEWGHFDYLQEQISAITSEADFMIDLMSNSDLYTDNGQLTDTGMATMGLHGQNYNVYMAQADKYAEEIKSLNAEIANDPNNTKLLERREELLGLQRESILAAEDEKQAIVDMVEEGINLELESLKSLIDAYTDSLDSAKDLYDYQKKVRDQTSEIAKLQKQISAYKNDTSEENRAVIQKLEVDLANAMEDLEETQYERYISDTKKLLDTLYNEYELILNQRLDNIDFLIGDMINTINTNSVSISETLATESANVGYTLSESMKAIWSNEGGAYSIITTYGEKFNTALTTVNQVLNGIALNVAKMVGESDETAKETVETTTPSTKTDTTVKPVTTTKEEKPKTTKTTTTKTITVGGKINAGSAKIYEYAGDTSGERQYFRNDPIYTVLSEKSGYLKVRHHTLKKGVTGWFKKADVKAYKTGGLVDYTGLAQLDGTPDKPELVLNAEDTKNFISLRDALRSITDGSMSPLNVFGDDNSGFDMAGHVASMESPVGVQTTNIGDITYEINIPIDHVSDYNDFMNQMRKDGKFEKFIQSMTVDRMVGGSKLSKTKFKW